MSYHTHRNTTAQNMGYPASSKQVYWVTKLIDEKDVSDEFRTEVKNALDNGLSKNDAGRYLDILFDRSLGNRRVANARRNDTVTITEAGFYLFEDEAYRVQKTQDGQRLYAKKATGSGWDYSAGKGVVFQLAPEMLMTAMEIASFGGRKGFCVNCSDGLSDPISKKIGLGTSCGPSLMGSESYRAARKHHIATDAECAAHDAQLKASAKARREAKKAQAAKEVVLVG